MIRRLLGAVCFVSMVGCDGSIVGQRVEGAVGTDPSTGLTMPQRPDPIDPFRPVDPVTPKPIVTACTAAPSPGSAPMRRLSHEEYEHAVEDLFGNATLARQVSAGFIQDSVSLGFRNGARFLDVKAVMFQKYQEAAETVATQVTSTANLPRLVTCNTSQGEACARQAIERLLTRAFRRPPSTTDLDRYVGIWRRGAMAADFRTGMEWVVGAVLQAPKFLYRVEVDAPNDAQRALGPYELASRLSFLFWQSGPDDALLEAARTGQLATAADVEREARRMLTDPKADRLFNFFEQWMDIDELAPLKRDTTAFPGLSAGLADLLREEAHQFVQKTVLEGDGSFDTLMTSNTTYVNGELARHYGIAGITGTTWQRHTFTSGLRGGLFMNTAALVSHDKQSRTSIVNRGMRVRTQLLCQTVPAPPDNVPLNLQPITGEFSQADRLAQHRSDPSCSGCHTLLDPLGEPFENVDAVGRERTRDEGGHAVRTLGEVHATRDADGPVTSGLNLMQKLAASDEARECLVTQLFRFGHGRQEETGDLCSRQRALERFKTSSWNVRELFVALTQTDDFLYKPGATP
ncbi:MAG: DUF1592 domain-containing protein [Myxococcaceae bacterium]|jgi:hypothetical protein|nr:DUF1592 domain-containing protein [Myxococcaceae bacterium]